jgi:hypothetical protein
MTAGQGDSLKFRHPVATIVVFEVVDPKAWPVAAVHNGGDALRGSCVWMLQFLCNVKNNGDEPRASNDRFHTTDRYDILSIYRNLYTDMIPQHASRRQRIIRMRFGPLR